MITLRPYNVSDTLALVALLNDAEVNEYLSARVPFPYTEADARWWISIGCHQEHVRAITVNDELVGCISVVMGQLEASLTGEIAYWLGKKFWGQGIATQAVNQITNDMFASTKTARLFGAVYSGNLGSMRVLEKCGYTLEGIHKKACFKNKKFYDHHLFAKIAAD